MLCSNCGKIQETEDNIIPLCCPFCHKPYENGEEKQIISKKRKISHIPPQRPSMREPLSEEEIFQDWLKKAEAGDGSAYLPVATAYMYGKGVEQNYTMCFQYSLKSAEYGDVEGIYMTACLYFNGFGVEMNFEKAFEFFQQASEKNHPRGHIMLGICYTSEESDHYDCMKGLKLLEKGAQLEPDAACVPLAILYSDGKDIEKNIKKALYWLNVGVQHDNQIAMYHLASWLIKGELVPRDYPKAIELLIQSSELQCPESCYLLAQCYFCGAGVLENWSMGIRYTRKADQLLQRRTPHIDQIDFLVHPLFLPGFGIAELEAMVEAGTSLYIHYALGKLYEENGEIDKAISVFLQCGEENLPQALCKLGDYYVSLGDETVDKGISYYEKSAESHYAPALCALGRCYEEGIGLQINPQFAYFYYHKSSIQDYALGYFHLGLCHLHGISVSVNEKKAQHFFHRSYEEGYYPAHDYL